MLIFLSVFVNQALKHDMAVNCVVSTRAFHFFSFLVLISAELQLFERYKRSSGICFERYKRAAAVFERQRIALSVAKNYAKVAK